MVIVGIFMLLHETLSPDPRPTILAAALALLAGPAVIRTVIEGYFGRK